MGAFALELFLARDQRLGRPEAVVLATAAALSLVYAAGAWQLESTDLTQFGKGFAKFAIHFGMLTAAVAYLRRRPPRFYGLTLTWFIGGFAVSALYASLQLVGARAGVNIDQVVLEPLTGLEARTLDYTLGGGPSVTRVRGLTHDPNHLAIMLLIPVLVLLPLASQLERRRRMLCAVLLAFFLVVIAATLSRSAVVGLAVGLAVLAVAFRRALLSRELAVGLGAAAVVVVAAVAADPGLSERVADARVDVHGPAGERYVRMYEAILDTIRSDPLVGRGLNNFAEVALAVAGKRDYGPHSFYVQQFVETGVVGATMFTLFLIYVWGRVLRRRRSNRHLAWGLAAALAATMAANVFYLTMTFAYFYVFLALTLAELPGASVPVEGPERAREEPDEAAGRVLAEDVLPPPRAHLDQPGGVA